MLKVVMFGALVAVALAVGAQGSQAEHVFAGTYTTDSLGEPGPIRAVFTAAESEGEVPTWSVVFTVTFDTADYAYTGSAEGDLAEGELAGEVEDTSGDRTFVFRGRHRSGRFHATHAEITDGFMEPTGTMTLEAQETPQ